MWNEFAASIVGGMFGSIMTLIVNMIVNRHKAELQQEHDTWKKQSTHYLELWKSLNELKVSADKLWIRIGLDEFKEFTDQLVETEKAIDDYSILLDKHHHQRLVEVIGTFKNYYVGKKKLLDFTRGLPISPTESQFTEISTTLDRIAKENLEQKNLYVALLKEIDADFRGKIRTI
ncbi:MAG: hypothetical protein KAS32_29990 [Candidatus Peribacteraceae bacterium]|nr:hypothetical protein [Candidatus Peribacteraceae bacterium]